MNEQIHVPIHIIIVSCLLVGGTITFSPENSHGGSLEPPAPPAPTMKTLEQTTGAWDQILPADDTGDPCNSSRFTCVMNGEAVRDNETGLVWERSPDLSTSGWLHQKLQCPNRITGNRRGWRLPTVHELASLMTGSVLLPSGHPFNNIFSDRIYWTSTTRADDTARAWAVFGNQVGTHLKTSFGLIWCVRGGQNHGDRY
ncbi:DUF1566 domain-containing protein [Candidatus Nitronereus thalassa]|uniref:DUF1566 domain-containing protein n=1 Tax=Candidatus Nitronereus thalassa TaxID=3020898 RepID=A0ABU3K475_9BACT|nr:DUF1566 domain-containing protein [Candidatus Nitronereus thalassa]MDT7041194.1 DUF1566 domain-containing protein [Candidatus Nitronereus thalassa]